MDQLSLSESDSARHIISSGTTLAHQDELKSAISDVKNTNNSSSSNLDHLHTPETNRDTDIQHDTGTKCDSDAETIVLSSKDYNSPSKAYKLTKYTKKIANDCVESLQNYRVVDELGRNDVQGFDEYASRQATSSLGKRKRSRQIELDSAQKYSLQTVKSISVSPVSIIRSPYSRPSALSSEMVGLSSPVLQSYTLQSQARSLEHSSPSMIDVDHPRFGGYEDGERSTEGRFVRQPISGDSSKLNRDFDLPSGLEVQETLDEPVRLASSNSSGDKCQIHNHSSNPRIPSHNKISASAPLPSYDYQSDDSSTSVKNHLPNARVRNSTAPTTRDSLSSAKIGLHKKHVNCSGQTPLAVACSRGKLELVQKRYEERPQDINVPDNAMNTPLHIASLEGWTDIVRFLVGTGNCELDCVNTVKDTPLHDAIDNRNIEVVKLLLDAGANPSKPNQAGNDPLDLLNQQDNLKDEELAEVINEMKEAVITAREKYSMDDSRKSEDFQSADKVNSEAMDCKTISTQDSPTQYYDSQNPGSISRKVGTARSLMKTTERVLYQKFDLDALRVAARDGDIATASRVLDVRPGLSDPQTLYNAAKGGHDAVINLLFALGDFDPDPDPMNDLPQEYSTPILAAIGKDHHLEVIKLFLGNSRFNPARRTRGETYYEIATRRGGPKWQEESLLFKNAFESYQKTKGITLAKSRSPGPRRESRGSSLDTKKNTQGKDFQNSRPHLHSLGSYLKEREVRKPHRKNVSLGPIQDEIKLSKRSMGKIKNEDESPGVLSEPEVALLDPPKKRSQSRKTDTEITIRSENQQIARPRRKLFSRKALKDERELERASEKLRRARCASTNSSASENFSREREERLQLGPEIEKSCGDSNSPDSYVAQEHKIITQSEKRVNFDKNASEKPKHRPVLSTDSRDYSHIGKKINSVNRSRKNESNSRPGNKETSTNSHISEGKLIKKKRNEDDKNNMLKINTFNVAHGVRATPNQSYISGETSSKYANNSDVHERKLEINNSIKPLGISKDLESNERLSSRSVTSSSSTVSDEGQSKMQKSNDRASKSQNILEDGKISFEPIKKEYEPCNLDIKCEINPTDKVTLNNCVEIEIKQSDNKTQLPHFSVNISPEEKDGRHQQDVEHTNQNYTEDLEADRSNQEEQKLLFHERERAIQHMYEEQISKKTIILEQQRVELMKLEDQEINRTRLSKLPLLLRWFDQISQPKTAEIAKLFSYIVGYRYESITTRATEKYMSNDPWMLNTQAAILLGEKDLQLSRSWERVFLTTPQKRGIWSTCNGIFLMLDGNLPCLRKQLFDVQPLHEVIESNKRLFLELDLFFVKVTEFMFVVPNFPHLQGIEMTVLYRELNIPEDSDETDIPKCKMKWQNETQISTNHNFVPLPEYYINGVISRTEESKTKILKRAPRPDTFPRRMGLTRVYPEDSDYEKIYSNQKSRK